MIEIIAKLSEEIIEKYPMHQGFLENSLKELGQTEQKELETYVRFMMTQGHDLDFIASSYVLITLDTLRETVWFQKNGKYRHDSFSSVANDVYFNPEYMRKYMIGLAVSGYIWPQIAALRRHFFEHLPQKVHAHYLEIGPGHGAYFDAVMRTRSFEGYLGIDISETSCDLTRTFIQHRHGELPDNVEIRNCDFLQDDLSDRQYGAIVMGEVLEHVEEPQQFLHRIAELADSDTHIHITTCINAPAIDHIYLYRSIDEVDAQVAEAGLAICDRLVVPYSGKTLAESEADELALNVAYVLKKKP